MLGPQRLGMIPSAQDLMIPSFDPNAYSYSPFGTETPPTQTNSLQNSQNPSLQDLSLPEQIPETWFMSYEQAHEYVPPKYTDIASVDWSTFDLGSGSNTSVYNGNKSTSPYSYQQSPYQTFDPSNQMNQAGITSSSGDASEEDQSPPSNRWGGDRTLKADQMNDFSSIGGDDASDRYRLSSASSYYGTPQANILANDNLGSVDIDEFLRSAEVEAKRLPIQQQMAQMQMAPHEPSPQSRMSSVSRGLTPSISAPGSTGNGEHPYTISEAQKYAHMQGLSNDSTMHQRPPMPPTSIADDPSWSAAPDMSNPELTLDDEREDEDWVR